MDLVDRILTIGLVFMVVGIIIIVIDPASIIVFKRLITGPTDPIGALISLAGLSLTVSACYRKFL
jgi:hypothetical protein